MKHFSKKAIAWILAGAMCLNFSEVQILGAAMPESEVQELFAAAENGGSYDSAVDGFREDPAPGMPEESTAGLAEEENEASNVNEIEEADEASNVEFIEASDMESEFTDGSESIFSVGEPEEAVPGRGEEAVPEAEEEAVSEAEEAASGEEEFSFVQGDLWYSIRVDAEGEKYAVVLRQNDFNAASVTIPAVCNDPDNEEEVAVREISAHAFDSSSGLTEVIFAADSRIVSIGDWAFKNCVFTSVTIPASVQYIGEGAFFGTGNLQEVKFESGSKLTSIGVKAFDECAIRELSLPASLVTIGDFAFNGVRALTSLVFEPGSQLTSIGEGAFNNAVSLKELSAIPSGVQNIGNSAFYGSGIESLEFEPGSRLQMVGQWFGGSASIREVSIPASAVAIEDNAFLDNRNLETVIFEEGSRLETIGFTAFHNTGLKSIDFPANLQTIQEMAFYECISLTSISFEEGSRLETIGNKAFERTGVTSMKFPSGLKTIGDFAFNGSASLTSVSFEPGSQLTSIGAGAFNSASGLTDMAAIPSSVETIKSAAFYGTGIEVLDFEPGSRLQTVGQWFGTENASQLREVTIPASVTLIEANAFLGNKKLTTVTFEEGSCLETIQNYAFKESGLTSIVLPASLMTIGEYAFYGCASLASVAIEEGTCISSIGNGAFSDTAIRELPLLTFYNVTLGNAFVPLSKQTTILCPVDAPIIATLKTMGIPYRTVGGNVNVAVKDENGNTLNTGFRVTWYKSGSGASVGSGLRLYLPDGAQASDYSIRISLGKELEEKYDTPERISLKNGETTVSVMLQPIGTVKLSGRMTAESGEIPLEAAMTVTSVYGSEHEKTLLVAFGEDGSFTADIPNVTTLLEIKADGYYSRKICIISGKAEEKEMELGTLLLYPLPEAQIRLNMTKVSAIRSDSSLPAEKTAVSVLDGYTFSLMDGEGKTLSDFTREGNRLYLGEGLSGYFGQKLMLHTEYQDHTVSIRDTEVTLDENGVGEAAITVSENGSLAIDSVSGAVPARILVFDENGNKVSSAVTSSSWKSESLPDGIYRTVLIQKQDYFDDFQSIGLLSALGLEEGTDYICETGTVSGGKITVLQDAVIPEFDTSRFDYTEKEGTYVRVNKTTVMVGSLVSLRIAYELKKETAEGLSERKLVIPLRENLEYISGSATVDGKVSGQIVYDENTHTLTVPAAADKGQFRCLLMPVESGSYVIAPYLSFAQEVSEGTVSRVQPLGTVGLTAPKLDFMLPGTTNKTTVQASGTALSGSTVVLYEGSTEVGRTLARDGGIWNASIELQNTKYSGAHYIHAAIYDTYGYTYSTDVHRIAYHTSYVEVDHVVMKNFGHREITTTWTFDGSGLTGSDSSTGGSGKLNGFLDYIKDMDPAGGGQMIAPPNDGVYDNLKEAAEKKENENSYDFNPLYPEFTFQIFFDTEDPAALAERNPEVYVKTVGAAGDYEWITAYYDETTGTWIGSGDLDFYTIPYTIEVSYDQPEIGSADPVLDMDEIKENLESFDASASAVADALSPYYEMGEMSGTEDSVRMELKPRSEDAAPIIMEISLVDAEGLDTSEYRVYHIADGKELKAKIEMENGSGAVYRIAAGGQLLTVRLEYGGGEAAAEAGGFSDSEGIVSEETLLESGAIFDWESIATLGLSDVFHNYNTIDNMFKEVAANYQILENMLDNAEYQLLNATMCGGQMKLSPGDRAVMMQAIGDMRNDLLGYRQSMNAQIEYYSVTSGVAIGISSCSSLWGKRDIFKAGSEVWKDLNTYLTLYLFDLKAPGKSVVGEALSRLQECCQNLTSVNIKNNINSRYSELNASIMSIQKNIISRYQSCGTGDCPCGANCRCKPPEPPKEDQKTSDPKEPKGDPSGYVYEAVPSNRLAGVIATILKKAEDADASGEVTGYHWEMWNAEDYDQIQNQVTGVDGTYGWDVTFGEWRVLYVKEGYEAQVSQVMEVPPEWTDVNIGMVSTAEPELSGVLAYADSIDVKFSQYMDITTVTDRTVTMETEEGPLTGTLLPVNAESNAEGTKEYATAFRFTPDKELPEGMSVTVSVSGAESYNGKSIAQASQNTEVKLRISGILPVDVPEVYTGEPETLTFSLGTEGAGQTVTVSNLTPSLVTVESETVNADEKGMVTVGVSGTMAGNAVLQLSLEEYGLKLEQKVHVRRRTVQDLSGCEIILEKTEYTYNGKEQRPGVTVMLDGKEADPSGYTVIYTENVNAGAASVTVEAKENGPYIGSCLTTFTIKKAANSIRVSNFKKNANGERSQSFSLDAKAGGVLTYQSNHSAVTVSSKGMVTISRNYVGTAVITITAGDGNYETAVKKITVTVSQIADTITASNYTKTASAKSQSFTMKVKHLSKGALKYSSNHKAVKVSSKGKVTIAKNFIGKAKVTIKTAGSGIYKAGVKTITITVNPPKTAWKSVKSKKSKTAALSWKKNSMATGYQIQYSTNKKFASGNKTVTVKKKNTVSKTLTKLKGKKTYYVRIRTYKTVSGVKYYSGWSSTKKVKVKK